MTDSDSWNFNESGASNILKRTRTAQNKGSNKKMTS